MATDSPVILCVTSPFEIPLSKTEGNRLWADFLKGGTGHSERASTLPYVMRRAEREQVEYVLKAMPGRGYWIEPAKKED